MAIPDYDRETLERLAIRRRERLFPKPADKLPTQSEVDDAIFQMIMCYQAGDKPLIIKLVDQLHEQSNHND